jgi:uncharacterized protein YegL
MNKPIFDPSAFTTSKAKPLPVILLLDVSASMSEVVDGSFKRTGQTVFKDGKTWELVEGGTTRIQLLNEAVRKMLVTLAREESMGTEFLVSIITFGADTRLQLSPTKASIVSWTDLATDGETPLGSALALAKELIEDKERIPSRAWRPTVILVSDGKPTDLWEEALAKFITLGRSSKCDRMAMAIGAEADMAMLGKFIAGTGHELFQANQAENVQEFFKRVTMSVVSRTHSQNPNLVPSDSDILLDGPSRKATTKESGAAQEPADDEGYW